MARWGPQVRPNPGSSTKLGHEEGAPVSPLERRYRLLLRALPAWYRAAWEQDMVATFLAGVEAAVAGDELADLVGEFGWPDRAEVVSVVALALRLRLGGAPDHAGSRA